MKENEVVIENYTIIHFGVSMNCFDLILKIYFQYVNEKIDDMKNLVVTFPF